MKVYTYFTPVPDIRPENALHRLWRESWVRNGWEPVVLGVEDALAADKALCAEIIASRELQRGPCPAGYNLACHLRWIAHSVEGGLMVDYDVLNKNFSPADLRGQHLHIDRPLFLTGNNCPCAVYAEPQAVRSMLEVIQLHARQVDGGEYDPTVHPGELSFVAHDQAIFERFSFRWSYPKKPLVVNYEGASDEWRHAALIHFPNGTTPKPRGEFILRNNLLL